jgi:hypothetical protein
VARKGFLVVLQFLVQFGASWNDWTTCQAAAAGGHVDVLQWAKAMGCATDLSTCVAAAEQGQLGALKWLRLHDTECDFDDGIVFHHAAANGHLAVLVYALDAGWDTDKHWSTCESAALGGHLEAPNQQSRRL